jgi:hypothetical protein
MQRTAILSALRSLHAPPEAPGEPSPWSGLTQAEWEQLAQLAVKEGVAPLLYQAWRGCGALPADVLSRLHQTYLLTAMSNALRFEELTRSLHALSGAGIQVIVLKGAALAVDVYADPGLRPMVDVDLLIHRGDMPQALALFQALGYAVEGAEIHAGATLTYENEIALVKPGRASVLLPQITTELHWSLLDSPFHQLVVDMNWFWTTAQPLDFEGEETLMLGVEAQLLHLCAHLWLHHRGEGLLWLHDIATIIHRHQATIEWGTLLSRAQDFHIVLPLQRTLPLVADAWAAPVPAATLEQLRALVPSLAEERVFRWLTAESRPPAQRFWADLWGQPDWDQRASFAMRQLFPTPAYMRQRYQTGTGWALPLFYPYRWLLGVRGVIAMKLPIKTREE